MKDNLEITKLNQLGGHYNIYKIESETSSNVYSDKVHYGMLAEFSCSGDIVFTGIKFKDDCIGIFVSGLILAILCLIYEYIINKKTFLINEYYKTNSEASTLEKLKLTGIHFIQTLLLYIIMIGVMSYNMYIIIIIITSNAIGYMIFADIGRKIETSGCCNFN